MVAVVFTVAFGNRVGTVLNAAGEEGLVPSNYLERTGYIYEEPVVLSAASEPTPSLGDVAVAAH